MSKIRFLDKHSILVELHRKIKVFVPRILRNIALNNHLI